MGCSFCFCFFCADVSSLFPPIEVLWTAIPKFVQTLKTFFDAEDIFLQTCTVSAAEVSQNLYFCGKTTEALRKKMLGSISEANLEHSHSSLLCFDDLKTDGNLFFLHYNRRSSFVFPSLIQVGKEKQFLAGEKQIMKIVSIFFPAGFYVIFISKQEWCFAALCPKYDWKHSS